MKKETTLAFTGDIGFDNHMRGKWADPALLSQGVLDFLRSADHVIPNVEGALVVVPEGYDPNGRGIFMHPMDPNAVRVLRNIKADIWNLANNHTMDCNELGISETLRIAKEEGVQTIGSGMNVEDASVPVYLEEAGGIGIFAVGAQPICRAAAETTPGCLSWAETERIEKIVRQIKSRCRWCILVSHGSEEFLNISAPYTRARYHQFLEMGVDIIVGHHPHICLNYETLPGKAIFYSLGNFIFDTDYQRAQCNTDRGMLLKLHLTEDGFTFDALGTKIVRGEEHVTEGELPAIFADLQEEEYNLLFPLAAKAFFKAEKKRKIFMKKEEYGAYTEKDWAYYFENNCNKSSLTGHLNDFRFMLPYVAEAEKELWKNSKHPEIVDYLTAQL